MRLDEAQKESLSGLTVAVVVEARFAASRAGANPLKVWDQVQDRVRMAARTTSSVEEWGTSLCRSLQLAAPGNSLSSALVRLADEVRRLGAAVAWLDLVEREYTYLMASAKLVTEQRRKGVAPGKDDPRDQRFMDDHGPELALLKE